MHDLKQVLAQLQDYQIREQRSSLARNTSLQQAPLQELREDGNAICDARYIECTDANQGLHLYDISGNSQIKLSPQSMLDFFEQKAHGGFDVLNPLRGMRMIHCDPLEMKLQVQWSIKHSAPPQGLVILPSSPPNAHAINESLQQFISFPERFPALLRLLRREPMNFSAEEVSLPLNSKDEKVNKLCHQVLQLDQSCMAIQGPPGTGKTWTGSRLMLQALLSGKTCGLMALSNKAIDNFYLRLAQLAQHCKVTGLKLCRSRLADEQLKSLGVQNWDNRDRNQPNFHLLGGTIWQLCKLPAQSLDYLFIEEAGQIPLAWTLAAGSRARNIILLGDPCQLPQVSRSRHPGIASQSVLQHLSGNEGLISPEHGHFLDKTYRMNEQLTRFVSDSFYQGKLQCAAPADNVCKLLPELGEAGINWVSLEHKHRASSCPEEGEFIQRHCQSLLDQDCSAEEIMIITPFRAQENLLRNILPDSLAEQIGTVDRFQGREANIVFYSMCSSRPENLPGSGSFLFSPNRLNVALSRARQKVIILCNDDLLLTKPASIDDMKNLNLLCRLRNYCKLSQ